MPSSALLTLAAAAGFAVVIAGYAFTLGLGHFLYRNIPVGRQRSRMSPRTGRGCLEWTAWNGAAAMGLGVGGIAADLMGKRWGGIAIGAGFLFGFLAAGWFLQGLYFLRKEAKARQAAWVEEEGGEGGR
jgi:hypothetical protein